MGSKFPTPAPTDPEHRKPPAPATAPAVTERIKELEAELAKRTQERDEALPFMVALKGRHNGYDPGNSKMFPAGPPATPEVALNELIEEREWLVNSELQQAQSDAERLRKAIETHRLEWGAGRVIESNNRLWSALSPSPAAASGEECGAINPEWLSKMAEAEDAAGDISIGTSAPAAETQGSAQYHSEGAKIPEGGSGSSAAESEGGVDYPPWEVNSTYGPRCIECRLLINDSQGVCGECYHELSARLVACEKRCRELEAGIRAQLGPLDQDQQTEVIARSLRSLLAPKAGGKMARKVKWASIWKRAAKAHRRAAAWTDEIARHHREDYEKLREEVSVETITQRLADDSRRASVEQIADMLDVEVELKADRDRWKSTAHRWEAIAMNAEREKLRLYEEIRQLVVERDWLRAGINRVAESLAGPYHVTARRALSDLLRYLHPSR